MNQQLWTHQISALSELDAAIEAGEKHICITSPTGGGKSRIMFEHIVSSAVRAGVFTDRKLLFTQLGDNMIGHGIDVGYIAAGHESSIADVQICMTQTVTSRFVNGLRQLPEMKHAYWDEAHKMGGDTMQEIRRQLGEHVDIGFTATPLGIGHVYDKLIVAGTTSELRKCGALVPAYHYGPDEPDKKWIGTIKIGEGECGIPQPKRMMYVKRIFARVVEQYRKLNPEQKPTILFAPGVAESIWFTEELTSNGIAAAHIDGENVWLDGEQLPKTQELVDEIKDRLESGDIKVVSNRFVLREGIDWPFVEHGIFATVFGSLTSYLQAGGRLLRTSPGKSHATIQDHGAAWWRHGSLNANREWNLEHNDRIVSGMRERRIREKKEREPIVCLKCNAVRLHGPVCQCGFSSTTRVRMVMQKDGSLREMRGDIFRKRRIVEHTRQIETQWASRVYAVRNSKKETVKRMTFAQLEVSFARDHDWQYPPRDLPAMPVRDADWFRPIKDIPQMELTR